MFSISNKKNSNRIIAKKGKKSISIDLLDITCDLINEIKNKTRQKKILRYISVVKKYPTMKE